MIRLKPPHTTFHALNCVKPERPQNKYIKRSQFKSREQNGGQIDPRINTGGRPKFFAEALAKELRKKVKVQIETEDGRSLTVRKTRAELIAQALVDSACTMKPHSVAAFRTICEIVEPTAEEVRGSTDREFTRAVLTMLMERKVDTREI